MTCQLVIGWEFSFSTVRFAFNQFGNVKSVHFIPNYIEPRNIPQCALVEMEDLMQVEAVVSMTSNHYLWCLGCQGR